MAFLPYDENRIYSDIARFGWKAPQDVDPNSTNCQLNTLANAVHKERFAINPYTFELAGLVRSGCMERETAISRLQQPEDPQIVSSIAAKLGLSQSNRV
jgi:hypothetical protein